MAWLDDRAWSHPKLVDLSDAAFRLYINGISYSAGMGTRGSLSGAQIKLLGGTTPTVNELLRARLWNRKDGGGIAINSWDEHNGKRDDRRAADRERKRLEREKNRQRPQDSPQDVPRGRSAGQSTGRSPGTSQGTSAGPARVEGSEGSEGLTPPPIHPRLQQTRADGRTAFDYDQILKEV